MLEEEIIKKIKESIDKKLDNEIEKILSLPTTEPKLTGLINII